ncbi:unnamed protein product, partial [Ectocarpus sp. 12 AP-2014]
WGIGSQSNFSAPRRVSAHTLTQQRSACVGAVDPELETRLTTTKRDYFCFICFFPAALLR